jgi:hypothetical protein
MQTAQNRASYHSVITRNASLHQNSIRTENRAISCRDNLKKITADNHSLARFTERIKPWERLGKKSDCTKMS